MYCIKCGAKLDDKSRLCNQCGQNDGLHGVLRKKRKKVIIIVAITLVVGLAVGLGFGLSGAKPDIIGNWVATDETLESMDSNSESWSLTFYPNNSFYSKSVTDNGTIREYSDHIK